MKTVSSRFFVVLLHLLGVSNHHLPSWYYDYLTTTTGIRGVHPHSIVLERLDLREVGGLDGVDWLGEKRSEVNERGDPSSQIAREPFWLQDSQDGKCLGPSGDFSECGDATLWFVQRRGTQRKSLRMGPFGVEEVLEQADPEEPYRYALQIADNDHQTGETASATSRLSSFFFSWRQRRQQRRQRDCLVPSSSSSSELELGSCTRQKTAWSWRVDSQGFLYLPKDATKRKGRACLKRTKVSSAVLSSCEDNTHEEDSQQRLVQFSLVRYHATSNPTASSPLASNPERAIARPPTQSETKETLQSQLVERRKAATSREGLPSNRDIAHSHASESVRHSPIFEMNLAGRPLLSAMPSKEERKESNSSPFAALKDSNPILFLGTGSNGPQQGKTKPSGDVKSNAAGKPGPQLTPPPPGKMRRVELNPYIAASKDERWVDPQTGLEYHTDLTKYLGHDRKEYGRHTLVGVGLFTKTMLKIKVYGIALYVSKNDVLADPSFQQYAGLSSEELRNRPDFYELLRKDPSEGASFDRTILLKTNMQLGTETMRSSLDSDWKMLTEEAKEKLINTSMEPRPAEQQMLDEIQRADNPSRCSCSQVAPEEYQADPSCCARGIELGFTWRKNGDIEVRLNGRLMDSFPRPDIGLGIFFEYLRQDDPFSPDFLERAVDGIPFLLAPLAQVLGITSSVLQAPPPPKVGTGKSFLKTINGATEAFSSHAAGLAGAMQNSASEAAANAAQAAGDAMRHFGEEAERKRLDMWKHMVEISQQNPADVFSEFVARAKAELPTEELPETEPEHQEPVTIRHAAPHGRFFRPVTSQWFGETLEASDEIAPMVHPTMNKTILSLVHMYLLLILILSFPPTNSNRPTKFVVRRSSKMIPASSSESSLVKYGLEAERDRMFVQMGGKGFSSTPRKLTQRAKMRRAMMVAPEPPRTDSEDCDTYPAGDNEHALKGSGNGRTTGKMTAPEPVLRDILSEMCPEDDCDPALEGNAPQRIHIDLSLQDRMDCKERRASNGTKRLVRTRVAPKSESEGADCETLSIKSSVSGTGRNQGNTVRNNNSNKKGSANDKMKKSLSYFL